jgi:hypothetical protein
VPSRGELITVTAETARDGPAAQGAELLIDVCLPGFDTTAREHLVVEADLATTWQALCDLDLMQVHTPLMDVALQVRLLPGVVARALGRQRPPEPEIPELKLRGEGPGLPGWLPLGEVPGREIAFGAVGRFWQPDIDWYDVAGMGPEDFAAFAEPGWGRIAASLSLRPYGRTRTLVSYEARTATPDPASARRFRSYWLLVRPFVGHILRAVLASLRDDAERATRGW